MTRLKKKILIIGGSAAGPAAAAKAKRTDPSNEVILFEKGKHISIGTCEIPYVLSKEIKSHNDIVFYSPEQFQNEKHVEVKSEHHVDSINRTKKIITVTDLKSNQQCLYSYDKLILATGSRSKTLSEFPTICKNVFYVKTIGDLAEIQEFVTNHSIKNTTIIGCGMIGLELIDFVKSINSDLTFIEKNPLPLSTFEPEISEIILQYLRQSNIEFYGNVQSVAPIVKEDFVKSIKFRDGLIETDLILITSGISPNCDLAHSSRLTLTTEGPIKVSSKLQTSDDNIFAAGDCISVTEFITGRPMWFPFANLAHNQGHIAGANAAAGAFNNYQRVVRNVAVKIGKYSVTAVGLSTNQISQYSIKSKEVIQKGISKIKVMPNGEEHTMKIIYEPQTYNILGANLIGGDDVIGKANLIAFAIKNKLPFTTFINADFSYTPNLTQFIDSLTLAANKIRK